MAAKKPSTEQADPVEQIAQQIGDRLVDVVETIEQRVADSIEQSKAELEAAEALLERLADDQVLAADDYALFSVLNWDQHRVKREVERVRTARRLCAECGTLGERADIDREATEAEQLLEKEGSKIDAQIEKLQAKKDAMTQDAVSKRRHSDKLLATADELRKPDVLPAYVRDIHKRRFIAEVNPIDGRLNQVEGRLRQIDTWLTLEPGNAEHACVIRGIRSDIVKYEPYGVSDGQIKEVADAEAWGECCAQFKAERDELEKEAKRLRDEAQKARDNVNALLDHYIV